MKPQYLIAFLYIFYGITKLIIGLSIMTIPINIIKNIPVLNWFIKTISDTTFAGRFYEYILLVFGIYTITHGLALLNVFPRKIHNFIESDFVFNYVFILFGVILLVFYCLVLYTNIPISKNVANYNDYKLLGIGSGAAFLVVPLLWYIFEAISPWFVRLNRELQNLIILLIVIIALIIIEGIYSYLQSKHIPIRPKTIIPADYQNAYEHTSEITNKAKERITTIKLDGSGGSNANS